MLIVAVSLRTNVGGSWMPSCPCCIRHIFMLSVYRWLMGFLLIFSGRSARPAPRRAPAPAPGTYTCIILIVIRYFLFTNSIFAC